MENKTHLLETIKLSDFRDDGTGMPVLPPKTYEMTITCTNIDDIFRYARSKGIKEIEVTDEQMTMIATVLAANIKYNMELSSEEIEEKTLSLLKEGKVDKFLGVKLLAPHNT